MLGGQTEVCSMFAFVSFFFFIGRMRELRMEGQGQGSCIGARSCSERQAKGVDGELVAQWGNVVTVRCQAGFNPGDINNVVPRRKKARPRPTTAGLEITSKLEFKPSLDMLTMLYGYQSQEKYKRMVHCMRLLPFEKDQMSATLTAHAGRLFSCFESDTSGTQQSNLIIVSRLTLNHRQNIIQQNFLTTLHTSKKKKKITSNKFIPNMMHHKATNARLLWLLLHVQTNRQTDYCESVQDTTTTNACVLFFTKLYLAVKTHMSPVCPYIWWRLPNTTAILLQLFLSGLILS